ncbi:T9SS type A sorting domain-containing protein [Adhaeribacter terreus]|uniref:T9SS type A sorting domain-containing protein n=2 Tax=Adhaeribacter terreus TaxID=529703 RepID=A0ABW0E9W0_9BACT
MIRLAFLAASFFVTETTLLAQTAPTIAWDKTFGGSLDDRLYDMKPTSDGGYILGGWSKSGITGDKSQVNRGPNTTHDYWIVKTDANGVKQWDKTFGGDNIDLLQSVLQTADGGYILGGWSSSGQTGDKSQPNKSSTGSEDFWIVKIDALGNKQWDKTFGGSNGDQLVNIINSSDGGYILAGTSTSSISGDKSSPLSGVSDFWIVKIDATGNKIWDKTFGGTAGDDLYDIVQTTDGGYILTGISDSPIGGHKSEAHRGGNSDYWIVKIDALGNKQWDKTFGGSSDDRPFGIQQSPDGGYVVNGWSNSGISGDKSQASKGGADYWVIKTDALGSKIWDRTFGGLYHDYGNSVELTVDGGFVIGGSAQSGISGDKTQANFGSTLEYDYWLVKVDALGNKVWDKTLGASVNENLNTLIRTIDNGLAVGGYSNSNANGTKTQASQGSYDYWVVKLNPTCADLTATLTPTCGTSGTNVNINVTGIQPVTTGTPSWTLTYTVNGVTQTATGTTNTFSLATNAAVGTVYSLVSIISGTCTNNLTGSFTVQAVPSAPTVTPGNSCGTGTVTLSASGAPAGGNYIWYDAATAGNVLQTNTTDTFTTPSLTASATYYVALTNNAGCESPRTPVTATITNLTVTTGPAQTLCEGAPPVQLTGNPSGGTWAGPGVSVSGLFTPPSTTVGTHTLTYTVTQNGCTDSTTQTIIVTPVPVINAGQNDTVCADAAPFQLTGFSPAGGTWSGPGVNATGLFTPTTALAGTQNLMYSVTQNGCLTFDYKLVVIPTPPVQPVISLHSADTLIASTTGSSYEWKYNNTVLPTTTQKLKVTTSGTYAVRVKDAANCASLFSADYIYTVSGLKEELQNSFSLYPNPTSGFLTLELSTAQSAEVTIFNALSQQILHKTVAKTEEKVQFDLSKVAKGIYLVQVQTEKQVVVKKIVVE